VAAWWENKKMATRKRKAFMVEAQNSPSKRQESVSQVKWAKICFFLMTK